jgi:hypothetical protein
MLQAKGKRTVCDGGLSIGVKDASIESVLQMLQEIEAEPAIDPLQLASTVPNKISEKWDGILPDELLCASFASAKLDVKGVQELLKRRFNANQ